VETYNASQDTSGRELIVTPKEVECTPLIAEASAEPSVTQDRILRSQLNRLVTQTQESALELSHSEKPEQSLLIKTEAWIQTYLSSAVCGRGAVNVGQVLGVAYVPAVRLVVEGQSSASAMKRVGAPAGHMIVS
jgi:hypothetical protein